MTIFQNKYLDLTLLVVLNLGTEIIVPIAAQAQLVPDATLGEENSVVTPTNNLQQFLIESGAARGENLFHSFSEFNINSGQQVDFANPEGIANILTRVTGNNASEIFGALGVNGDANLFLINPKGIVFGENASINLSGSFFASTAEQIDFTDGGSFSAVNPDASPLLTVNIPVGVQFGNNPASIQLEKTQIDASNVTLLGGEIDLRQATVNAPGGEITFGSLAEAGIVNFNSEFPLNLARGDISIGDRSLINVRDAGGGNIAIAANNFTLTDSEFLGGIGENLGSADATAGNIYLDAVGDIVLSNSNINNNLELNSIGNSGEIAIDARNLLLNNSRIVSDTKSTGNAGNIRVNVAEKLENISNRENNTNLPPEVSRKGLFSMVNAEASGNGGKVEIVSPEITLSGLGGIDSSTVGIGDGGKIAIQSDRLTIKSGAGVFANGRGIGDGGDIFIKATEFIDLSDRGIPQLNARGKQVPGGIIADVGFNAQSNSGNITLETKRLTITDRAFISTDTKGFGDAGDIKIRATELVEVVGGSSEGVPTQIVAAVRRNAGGKGGNIAIETQDLSLRDGAEISVGTDSTGNAGNLSVLATGTVEIMGISAIGFPSHLLTQVGELGSGSGGDILLTATDLTITDGGQISASTLGSGKGGKVEANISNEVFISGFASVNNELKHPGSSSFIENNSGTFIPGGIFASSPGLGDANALNINADSIQLDDLAQLSVSSQKQGAAGNLTASAEDLFLNNGVISAETIEGEEANIFLELSDLRLRDRSLITTNATQTATGGNIEIDTDTLLALNNSDITANAEDNFGGRISIEAQGVFGTAIRSNRTSRSDITATSQLGAEFSGTVDIDLSNADPAAGIVKLPDNVVDASQQITSSCNLGTDNSFVLTSRGGIAPNPQEFLRGQRVLQDWRLISSQTQLPIEQTSISKIRDRSEVVEAQKWIVNSTGKVELVADSSQSDRGFWSKSLKCTS